MQTDSGTIRYYLARIGRYPLATAAEESELPARIAGGDEKARSRLILANLRLVVRIARDFVGFGLPLLDLISEGNIGLMHAVGRFDPSRGASFGTYAAWWIKLAMRNALAEQSSTIRLPPESDAKVARIRLARAKLAERLGRSPTCNEIATETDLAARTVFGLLPGRKATVSLHELISQGEDGVFEDILVDEGAMDPRAIAGDNDSIRHALLLIERLEAKERAVVRLRFGLGGETPQTLLEVSRRIGRTKERVRQIHHCALAKLRRMFAEECTERGDGPGQRLSFTCGREG